ncbi:MAG: hypothetical protein ABR953_11605 [Candidatus Acidiferrales bacterium]|jgi:hypothetical protein
MSDITKNDVQRDATSSQRDPRLEWNQVRPRSLRSSGKELDEGCEITQAEGGLGLDRAIRKIDRRKP